MKAVKLSLAAALVASSAFAVENVKIDGQIKFWAQTTDASNLTTDGLFKKAGASGNWFGKVKATGDLTKKVGFGAATYILSSGGLENNVVSDVASGQATGTETNGLAQNPYWLGEAYFNYKAGNTVVQIGRQTLDTPLAYTETWNAAPNTFEAAVMLNNDLPNTTLVAASVSRGNGTTDILQTNGKTVVGAGTFSTLGTGTAVTASTAAPKGAYAFGAVNTSISGVTAQAWYYDIADAAKAYWLQADAKLPMNLGFGAQFANLKGAGTVEDTLHTYDLETVAYAVQATANVADINLGVAYSDVSKGTLVAGNVATGGKKSKLYTASIMSDGTIAAQPDVKSYKVSASTKVAGFDLGASYSNHQIGTNNGGLNLNPNTAQHGAGYSVTRGANAYDVNEIDLSVATKIDDINLAVYYVQRNNTSSTSATTGAVTTGIDTQAIRLIASINF